MEECIGRQVKHKLFGAGRIIAYSDGKITVDFSGNTKQFQFPSAFQSFLTTDDDVLHSLVQEKAEEEAAAKKKAEEDRQKRKAEEDASRQRSVLERASIQARKPVTVSPSQFVGVTRRHQSDEFSVAFKCNFCDGGSSAACIGFRGKCSDTMIRYNIDRLKRVWCSTGSICKRYFDGQITRSELDAYQDPSGKFTACYESDFLESWIMSAGVYQTGVPMHMNRAGIGSLAVMTTRRPNDREADRFIFAVFLIASTHSGDEVDEGSVMADPYWRIELTPVQAEKVLFWRYYFNANRPEKMVFGSGLHRYLTDIEAAQILRDIASIRADSFSKEFYLHFCQLNGIDPDRLESPYGPLARINN